MVQSGTTLSIFRKPTMVVVTGGALVTLGIAVTLSPLNTLVGALCDDNVPEFTVLRVRGTEYYFGSFL